MLTLHSSHQLEIKTKGKMTNKQLLESALQNVIDNPKLAPKFVQAIADMLQQYIDEIVGITEHIKIPDTLRELVNGKTSKICGVELEILKPGQKRTKPIVYISTRK